MKTKPQKDKALINIKDKLRSILKEIKFEFMENEHGFSITSRLTENWINAFIEILQENLQDVYDEKITVGFYPARDEVNIQLTFNLGHIEIKVPVREKFFESFDKAEFRDSAMTSRNNCWESINLTNSNEWENLNEIVRIANISPSDAKDRKELQDQRRANL